jgi:hypothetical protein
VAAPKVAVRGDLAAGEDARALARADAAVGVGVAGDPLQLRAVDDRADVRRRVEAVAEAQGLDALDQAGDEAVVDAVLGDDPAGGRAALPEVPNALQTMPSTARSRSASSSTMMAFLPPSSRWIRFSCSAPARLTLRPVASDR